MIKSSERNISIKRSTISILAVTKELTNGLEMAANLGTTKPDEDTKEIQGAHLNWSSVILKCSKLYPELFNPSSENTR